MAGIPRVTGYARRWLGCLGSVSWRKLFSNDLYCEIISSVIYFERGLAVRRENGT